MEENIKGKLLSAEEKAKKWRNSLKKIYNQAEAENDDIIKRIESIIRTIDPVELLCHISFLSQFRPVDAQDINRELRDRPLIHLITGLCMKIEKISTKTPGNEEVGEVIELLEKYFINYSQILMFKSTMKDKVPPSDGIILQARLQKMMSQVTSNHYPFQLEDILSGLYSNFDDFFNEHLRFSALDACNYGNIILKRTEKLVNERINKVRDSKKKAEKQLMNGDSGIQLQEMLSEKGLTPEQALLNYSAILTFRY